MQPPQLPAGEQPPQHQPLSQPSSQPSFSLSQSQPSSQTTGYRQYADIPPKPANDPDMGIYSAVYSGINVYEMEVNNVAVMRRQHDSWLNATQILKVAGVDKGRRTKILEKEIQTGQHEKVQGGYGKYQGTWIPFERGVEVCRQYGVEELLMRLLTYKRGQDGGAADVDTPTKEQAMAAQRKRMYNASSQESRAGGLSGTFFKNISSTAFHRQSSTQDAGGELPPNSQQSFVSDYGHADSAFGSQTAQPATADGEQPPRKRQRVLTPANSFGGLTPTYPQVDGYAANYPGSPTEPNESFIYSQAGVHVEHEPSYPPGPLRPLPYDMSPEAEAKRSMLMGLFMDPNGPDEAKKNALRNMIPQELDAPIDTQSHTALHWAATLSRMPLLRALIEAGASPFRVNALGETALMRACVVTNSMDHNSFPELLDVLGGTIDVRDDKGRTVLHHIAVTSAVKGRNAASRYYLESLLEWVVRQGSGSAPSSQNAPGGHGPSAPARMGIGRFISEIVNAQDNSGDTALNIAARIGNRSIVSQLLEVGADPNIANRAGLRPLDFGIGAEAEDHRNGDASGRSGAAQGSSQKNKENSDEVVNSISHLVNESSSVFQSEVKKKQQSIDALHSSLRATSAQIGEARRTLEALQDKLKAQQLARQKVVNLKRASHEEDYRLVQLEQRYGRLDLASANAWEMELETVLDQIAASQQQRQPQQQQQQEQQQEQQSSGSTDAPTTDGSDAANPGPDAQAQVQAQLARLPSSAVLRARIRALRERSGETHRAVDALRAQSKDRELKYRRLVALCTRRPEAEVDSLLDTLTRAVESEKGELEIARIRRFLGGVEGVA
ncbi:0dea88c1-b31a-41c0-b12e-963d03b3ca6f [Thermothielavioides terrestris]|uniref:Transcription factor SWI6 n=1 Tax=Thermothielavioides terrestris TaxID=2587410 RepID=A0A3S4B7U5_9PEZI|nr:0dea88c1-b31a-41c0-b12e-963d03b3ca6f [Thermothielavioides terrestris]